MGVPNQTGRPLNQNKSVYLDFINFKAAMAERPEDLNLPTAIVTKMIKDCLPPSCKVSKEANVAITKAASVFVLYATSSANTVAKENNRKTITGADVVTAMGEMEFDKFVRPLENSLASKHQRLLGEASIKKIFIKKYNTCNI